MSPTLESSLLAWLPNQWRSSESTSCRLLCSRDKAMRTPTRRAAVIASFSFVWVSFGTSCKSRSTQSTSSYKVSRVFDCMVYSQSPSMSSLQQQSHWCADGVGSAGSTRSDSLPALSGSEGACSDRNAKIATCIGLTGLLTRPAGRTIHPDMSMFPSLSIETTFISSEVRSASAGILSSLGLYAT